MMSGVNRKVVMASFADGPLGLQNFAIREEPLRDLAEGEALIRNIYATVDPSQSRRFRRYDNYVQPFGVGGLISGYAVGQVVRSRSAFFDEGAFYAHFGGGWEEYSIVRPPIDLTDPIAAMRTQRADPAIGGLPASIGILQSKGFTAYIAMKLIGRAAAGETVVVSGAAGAVGSAAVQLARLAGARTIGIAGGKTKSSYIVDELGADGAIDYREPDLADRISQACPDGIDVYLDNVGGEMQPVIMENMRVDGRFVISGLVSDYGHETPPAGPNLFVTIRKGFMIRGFLAFHFAREYPRFRLEMSELVQSGAVRARADIISGLENAGGALLGMLAGDNIGQRFIQISPDPTSVKRDRS